ncbi:MAG TPA: recombinase RecA [Spirochaetota bacterium]|nr:recombinase RecA [Spirochaetota bacterium]HOM37905.1 recombinase RecA [Spirochaetota bacterium]HPQ48709.1 recombinase RecA [Spirochaetota bacterium]
MKDKNLLDSAIKEIQKRFGEGVIMKLDQKEKISIPVIPTGIISLDIATGIGGLPRGRIVEIYGPESSGKTTIALSTIAQVQKNGGVAAFIDAEHALDPIYAKKLGVNLEDLYISQPDSGEQALEIAETLARTGQIDLIVIDSVAALVPRAEIEGNMGDSQIGLQARLMSQALRKITGIISKTNTCMIFINQIRMKIGSYGNPETTTGGMALKFYSSIRIEVRRGEALKDKEESYGTITKIKVNKNKMAPPFKKGEFMVLYDKGIYNVYTLLEEAVNLGIIERKGTFYYFGNDKIGQGKESTYSYFEANPDFALKIENLIREKYELPAIEVKQDNKKDEKETKESKKRKKVEDVTEELL